MASFDLIVGRLRKRFFQLDLRGKITAALLAAVLPLGAGVTLMAYVVAYHEITDQSETLLHARAQLEQREIELRLGSVLALAESLAGNSVTANALADSRGRESYLVPLLHNQKITVAGASLTVVDYRGRAVASSVTPAPDYSNEPGFATMLRTERSHARVFQRPGQEAALVAVLPVRYRLTTGIEGGVLMQVPLRSLLGKTAPEDSRWLRESGGILLAGELPRDPSFEIDVPLALPAPLDQVNLILGLARDRTDALRTLNLWLASFLMIGVLTIVGVVYIGRAGARFIVAPLEQIAAAAEEIAASGRPVARLPERRDDEFGRLSAAFNTMVARLAESYSDLEQRVAERTREYEESRYEAENASNLLRESVASVAQGFTIYDENDRLVLCNEAYRSFYETSRDLIVAGSTFEEIVRRGAERGQYQEAIGNVDEWVRKRVEKHRNASGEMIEQRLGDGRWLMIVEYRTPSGYIVGNRIDITQLKKTEEALREREIHVREHAEQLNAIFELSPDGFVSFDTSRCVKYASPAFLHLTGLLESDIAGLDEGEFSARLARECLPSARFKGVSPLRAAQRAAAGDQSAGQVDRRRQMIELAGAGKRVLEVGLRLSRADTVSQILYLRDVTHETEVDRMKSEFLSTAAHELRTPMASIYGFTELLIAQEFDDADRREFLNTIFRQSELMVSIINELLDLARIESRRGKDFTIARIDVRELLREVVTGFKPPNNRPSPQHPAGDAPVWVRADSGKLTQALSNVLSNAYKYSPDGGAIDIAVTEALGEHETQPRIGVRITDHGIGMTPEQLARVCERFYRADTSGSIPGTGLGMSIVKEIVELHGGEVSIESAFSKGTTVTVWLPAEQADDDQD